VTAVAAAVMAVGGLAAGVRWTAGVNGGDRYGDTARPMTWAGHTPIFGGGKSRVGWISEGADGTINVAMPASYASNPMNPTSVGVRIVYNDGGKPIGTFGPYGFRQGGLHNGIQLDPALEQQVIQDAIVNPVTFTTIPG
jgi:hypothetical protein